MPTGHAAFDLFRDGLADPVTGGTVVPAWSPDGRSLTFVEGPADERVGWLGDLASSERSRLVNVHDAYFWQKAQRFLAQHLQGGSQ
jgi:dipeptidyl-peptidase-4